MNTNNKVLSFTGLLLLICLSSVSRAQEFTLGPLFGANFTSVTNLGGSYKNGANAGISGSWKFGNYLGLSMQVLASQKGIDYAVWEDKGKEKLFYQGSVGLNYIDVPVLFDVYIKPRKDKWRPKFYGGPSFNFLNDEMEKRDDYFGQNLKPFQFALMWGGGCDYRVSRRSIISLEARYFYDLNQMIEIAPRTRYNHGGSILLGYHLSFGRGR